MWLASKRQLAAALAAAALAAGLLPRCVCQPVGLAAEPFAEAGGLWAVLGGPVGQTAVALAAAAPAAEPLPQPQDGLLAAEQPTPAAVLPDWEASPPAEAQGPAATATPELPLLEPAGAPGVETDVFGSAALPPGQATAASAVESGGIQALEGTAAPAAAAGPQSQRSNFSSLISLLSPPSDFEMPELSPQQQANLPQLQRLRQGTGTVSVQRNMGSYDGVNMACGMGYLSTYFVAFFAGLPDSLFQQGLACGTCVRLWCVDSVCLDPLVRNATFMVTDSCKDCKGQDLLVSAAGFANLTGVDINISPSLQIAYTFESCAPLIQGGIKMLASKNNNPRFLSFNFSNLKQLLRSVSIVGIDFQRTDYGIWELDSPGMDIPLAPPYRLVLTGANGQTLVKQLPSLRSQDLGINFDA